jgi:protocatechuate 3,4-dioxygenase beta subunit
MILLMAGVLASVAQLPADLPAVGARAATVQGRVTDAETGTPLRLASVALTIARPDGAIPQPRYTRTAADGTYTFREIPAGAYFLRVTKPRYEPMFWTRGRPSPSGTPLEVPAGGKVEQIDVAMLRTSAINGRITDELGDPLERAWVQSFLPGYTERGPGLVRAGGAATDDDGHYRIAGLSAGEYVIVATERPDGFGAEADADIGFVGTAYPGTSETRQAKPVAVRAGQEVMSIDIALLPARAARVSGTVFTANGQPASGVMLVLQSAGQGPGAGPGGDTRSAADGSFVFPAVVPGRYELHARLNRTPNEGAVLPFTVSGDDITGWTVSMSSGGRVRGRIVVPEGATGIRPADATVWVLPAGETLIFGAGAGGRTTNNDWTFETDFLLGARSLRVRTLPPGWYVSSIRRGLEDLTDAILTFTRDEILDDVEVHLARGAPVILGTATDDRGRPVRDGWMIVFADDPARWGPYSRYVAAVRADDRGQFRVDTLPPGRYAAAAVVEVRNLQWKDPAFLKTLRASATDVTLEPGTERSLTLKVQR